MRQFLDWLQNVFSREIYFTCHTERKMGGKNEMGFNGVVRRLNFRITFSSREFRKDGC